MSEASKIADKVIADASSDSGLIRAYFSQSVAAGNWEGNQRQAFQRLRDMLRVDGGAAREEAVELLWRLRINYSVQFFPTAGRDGFVQVVLEALRARDWLSDEPPKLLGGNEEALERMAELLPPALVRHKAIVGRRDYSLLTKYLHFLFPESYPIYDSQAAASIRMWAYFEFRQHGGLDGWERFTWERLADPSGNGYADLMRFYVRLWSDASADQRSQLQQLAANTEELIGGRVTVLDLIDKLLWQANGHPVHLGLIDPLL